MAPCDPSSAEVAFLERMASEFAGAVESLFAQQEGVRERDPVAHAVSISPVHFCRSWIETSFFLQSPPSSRSSSGMMTRCCRCAIRPPAEEAMAKSEVRMGRRRARTEAYDILISHAKTQHRTRVWLNEVLYPSPIRSAVPSPTSNSSPQFTAG